MKNSLFAALAALILVGCACSDGAKRGVADIDIPEENWTKYLDTDGKAKEIAFFTAIFSRNFPAHPKFGDKIGIVLAKPDDARLSMILGYMYKTDVGAFMLINPDTGEVFDVNDEDANATRLQTAHRVKFYEFSKNQTSVSVFEADKPVCEALKDGETINIKSASSRYANASDAVSRDFVAILTQAEFSLKNGAKILKSQTKTFTSEAGLRDVEGESRKFSEKTANDLARQERALKKICASDAQETEKYQNF